MADKYNDQYRIPSARLSHWDYGENAAYFVTICTAGKTCYFGHVAEGTMYLSALGRLAEKHWREIPEHFPFAILDGFIVMPNHLHGIININKGRDAIDRVSNTSTNPKDAINPVSTTGGITGKRNPMLHENLSRIVRWYKGRSTYGIRKIHADFAWQSRFHEHIIRNEQTYSKIADYIQTNPLKWQEDKYYIYI